MLHLKKIEVKNFRPYHGNSEFEFGEKEGLSVILGDNGIGKSSLIKAIKFVLYDELESTGDFSLKNELNIVAFEEGNYEFQVSLYFIYNKDSYFLKRQRKIKESVLGVPKSDNDFYHTVTLFKNNDILEEFETRIILSNIIPKKISEYILFEGETISKYYDLLNTNKNTEIYYSIRKILGLNLLENAKFDFEEFKKSLDVEKLRIAKEKVKNDKLSTEINKLNIDQENLISKKSEYEKQKNNLELKVNEYNKILADNQRTSYFLGLKDKEKENLEQHEKDLNETKSKIKEELKNYKSICFPILDEFVKIEPENFKRIKQAKENNSDLKKQIDSLKKNLDNEICNLCGSLLSIKEKKSIEKSISELSSKIIDISAEDDTEYKSYQARISMADNLISLTEKTFAEQLSVLKELEISLSKYLVSINSSSQKIISYTNQLEEAGGSADVINSSKNLVKAESSLIEINKMLKEIEAEFLSNKAKIDSFIKKISNDDSFSKIDSKIDKIEKLILVLDSSINVYSEKMRSKVEVDATNLFKRISENKEYKLLRFDSNYGLKLIDKEGREVPNISSGYLNLITLSLIYGLHKNSSLTGTIILDAPFSVLTNFHRDNILSAFQELSPQVILLVYKDQVDIVRVRKIMVDKLINEFEIYQNRDIDNSSYKTKVRRLK
jgi:DNA sulfur modification protein DndD